MATKIVSHLEGKGPDMKDTKDLVSFKELIDIALRKKLVLVQQPHIGNDVKELLAEFEQIVRMSKDLVSIAQTVHDADTRYLRGKANLAEYRIYDLQAVVVKNLTALVDKLNGELKTKVIPEVTAEVNGAVREIAKHIKTNGVGSISESTFNDSLTKNNKQVGEAS